jgi:predicted nucleic acid-binding protein
MKQVEQRLLDIHADKAYSVNMKPKVYLETSVVSYLTGRASRDVVIAGHQQATQSFWQRLTKELQPFISALVIKEASQGDPTVAQRRQEAIASFAVLAVTPEAERLAKTIMEAKGVPRECPEDALHIAIAAIGGMDFIATWNFSHINNPFTRMMIRQAVENAGYACPEIVSPDSFSGEET